MVFINKLNTIATSRISKYGAQYYTFAIFGVINYPLAYFYEIYMSNSLNTSGLWLRLIAALLCLTLLFKKKWPNKLQKFLPIYWYTTITLAIPVLTAFMVLESNFSLAWLVNANIGIMIMILILDTLSFLIIEVLGLTIGVGLFYSLGHSVKHWPNYEDFVLFLYMFFCIIVLGSIFSKNKEIFNNLMQKAKDELNAQLESIVTERTQELEQALLAKTEFLNNMSHEIRTPIGGMSIISKELVESWKSFTEDRRIELAKAVTTNAERLRLLVGNLLDLAKFSHGKMLLDLKKVDLNQLVREMIIETESLYLHGKNISFSFNFTSDNDAIIDAERISQVLRNLFVNAIKFSPNNSTITINIVGSEITYDDGLKVEALHLTITDQGIGIPEYEFDAIFNPFIQSSKTKTKAGGTGLGLAICKNIIEAHHGEIWAENMIGARFNFLIPKFQAKEMATHYIISENDIAGTKQGADVKANIVMIDDEEACLLSMELILSGTNYTFIKFENGCDALAYLKSGAPIDLILLDLMMPDIYGLNILSEIKSFKPSIPVILQTGSSDECEIKKAFAIGVAGYIKKPYQKKLILDEIKSKLV